MLRFSCNIVFLLGAHFVNLLDILADFCCFI